MIVHQINTFFYVAKSKLKDVSSNPEMDMIKILEKANFNS